MYINEYGVMCCTQCTLYVVQCVQHTTQTHYTWYNLHYMLLFYKVMITFKEVLVKS